MARKTSRSDLITGGFALLVILSFVAVVFYLQGVERRIDGERYFVAFDDVGGLSGSAPIIVAGQRVGRVVGIDTRQIASAEGGVEVVVQFVISTEYKDAVRIPVDTVAEVQMGSIFGFGGNNVVLKLGRSRNLVNPGQRLPERGQPPVNLNDVMKDANRTVNALTEGLDKIADVLRKDEFSENIDESLRLLRSSLQTLDSGLRDLEPAFGKIGPTFDSANALVEDLRMLLSANNEAIANMLRNFESASGRLDALLSDEADGVPRLVGGLNTIVVNLDLLLDSLNSVVLDNHLNVQISLENVRETTESLRIFARRIENNPSLLVWGGKSDLEDPATAPRRVTPGVDETAIRSSGRRPRRESD
jgi:ABC-type transporter Mla subunit MlaD